jgi:Flp pilus assembly protein TadG
MMNCIYKLRVYENNLGQGLVEFVIKLPIVLTLIMGVMDFGQIKVNNTTIASVSYEADRFGGAALSIKGRWS